MRGDEALRRLLEEVRSGAAGVDDALRRLERWPLERLDGLVLDHHRTLRGGFPEVVFGPGKTAEQVATAMSRLVAEHGVALATRVDEAQAGAVLAALPDARHERRARVIVVDRLGREPTASGGVAVVAAGTADYPVAEEAALTAEVVGSRVTRLHDVGVAGVHRLLEHLSELREATAVVAVAGMEGALPGVVAGLLEAPVIAVPTSIGYGAHLGGISALLTMLNACAPGLAVVNVDNGFGGGYMAAIIDRAARRAPDAERAGVAAPAAPRGQ